MKELVGGLSLGVYLWDYSEDGLLSRFREVVHMSRVVDMGHLQNVIFVHIRYAHFLYTLAPNPRKPLV